MTKRRTLMKLFPIMFSVLLMCLLSACDPLYTLHVTRSDFSPITCKDNAIMTYTVEIIWKDGERTVENRQIGTGVFYPDHPLIRYIPGTLEKIAWVQFSLYCGDDKILYFVTPRINSEDIVKKDERNLYYFLDE